MKNRGMILGLFLILLTCFFAGCGSARTVIADSVKGTVKIATGDNLTELVKGERLVNGQSVSVQISSDLTLLIDSDKHAYAGEGTEFSLEATGGKKSTRTEFKVKTGKLKFNIENKLGAKESFEVISPNAAMSVRGTVFSVEVVEENGKTVTNLSVDSGLVEAKTVEGGVERTVSVGAGQSEKFSGTAPQKGEDDKLAKTKKRTGREDGPRVRVLYTDDKGEEKDEYINFSEDFEGFAGKLYKGTWTLDLLGERIELVSVLSLDTDVIIKNGTLVTDSSNYIHNKGTASFGDEAYTYTDTHIETDGLAIENDGALMLRGVDLTVLSGTAVRNSGELSYEGYKSRQIDQDLVADVSIESGLFLYNTGFAYLNGVAIRGRSENYVVNDKDLMINHSVFYGEGETFVVNHDGASANLGDCYFITEKEGSVAFLNEGSIEKYDPAAIKTNDRFVPDAYGTPLFVVKAGTGLINKNTLTAPAQFLVFGGTGADNYGNFDTETYYVRMELDGGLGLLNRESGRTGGLNIFVRSGVAAQNFGQMGVSGNLTFGALEEYTGVLVTNEKSGIITGGATFYCSSLSDGSLLYNTGTVKDAILKFVGGAKNSNEYYKFPDTSNLYLYMANVLQDPYFSNIEVDTVMKDAILFKDEGVTENSSLSLCLTGKGSGTYEGYRACGSGKHEVTNGTAMLYSANGVGLTVDQGIECKLGGYTVQTGLQTEGDMYGLSSLYYVDNPGAFDPAFFTGNTAVLNKGIIKDSTVTAYMKGSKNTGFKNDGFTEEVNLTVRLDGDRNTGIVNNGTLQGGRIESNIDRVGGNTGVFNDKIIKDMIISLATGNRIALSICTEKSPYGEDIGILNSKNGQIDGYNSVLNIGVECPVVTALVNRNYLRIGSTNIRVYKGTGILCDEGSTFRTCGLSIVPGDETDDGLCSGTGMMIYGSVDLSGREGATEAGYVFDGTLNVRSNGSDFFGIYVANGGSFLQTGTTGRKFNVTQIYSKNNGHAVVNYGHLTLEYPSLTKYKSTWDRCISDSGVFSFLAFRIGTGADSDFRYDGGCPGPWYGMEYTDGDKIWN
ncbi:MAG: FecR domain-containing protein [Lachnospiraceae bacterium]|nr:FecR domain-containing protein [Lachnospiraceae bacterium]